MKDKFFWDYKDVIRYLMIEGEFMELVKCEDFKKIVQKKDNHIKELEKQRDNWKSIANKLKKEKK